MNYNYNEKHDKLLKSLGLPVSSNEELLSLNNYKDQNKTTYNLSLKYRDEEIISDNKNFEKINMKNELILCMTIELGEGKQDILNVYSNDSPKEKAYAFCIKNNLNLEAVDLLTQNIINNIDEIYKKNSNKNNDGKYNIYQNDSINTKNDFYPYFDKDEQHK